MSESSLRGNAMEKPTALKTRFAPSPTGFIHFGHIASALYVWGIARRYGAEVIIRIEDHDVQRSKQVFADALLHDLTWLGFVDSQTKVSYQSQQRSRYENAIHTLADKGLVYGCSCSRADVLLMNLGRRGEDLFYTGKCRGAKIPLDAAHVVRFLLPDDSVVFLDKLCGQQVQTPSQQCGDITLIDGKKNYSYHLANVVDDLADGVDLIIRGEDILGSTGRQLLLRRCLQPQSGVPTYYHHPLLYEENGKGKLSKLHHSIAIGSRREQGDSPETIFAEVLWQLGLTQDKTPVNFAKALATIADHC
jgi:glutamyl-tRNA synthetase/glutamyl-Q tRNA(Asp) synthetase